MSGRAGYPDDAGRGPAVEDRDVLGHRDPPRRRTKSCQVKIGGPTVGIEQLLTRDRERSPKLDQRQDPALACLQILAGGFDIRHPSQVRGRMSPAQGTGEVHQLAGAERRHEPLATLGVQLAPGDVGDRSMGTHEVVHNDSPLRLPTPKVPAAPPALESPGTLASASASISVTGVLVKR